MGKFSMKNPWFARRLINKRRMKSLSWFNYRQQEGIALLLFFQRTYAIVGALKTLSMVQKNPNLLRNDAFLRYNVAPYVNKGFLEWELDGQCIALNSWGIAEAYKYLGLDVLSLFRPVGFKESHFECLQAFYH